MATKGNTVCVTNQEKSTSETQNTRFPIQPSSISNAAIAKCCENDNTNNDNEDNDNNDNNTNNGDNDDNNDDDIVVATLDDNF